MDDMTKKSATGATKNSLGDCDMSDLSEGYCVVPDVPEPFVSPLMSPPGGVCGRPRGWDR
jgi:hypothetical protein